MSQMFQQENEWVTLVDRTTFGGDEIMYGGEVLAFREEDGTPKGKPVVSRTVHRDFVVWLYRTDKRKVWTTDGEFAHRYAVDNPPAYLVDHCGPEVADTSPIEVDTARLEGWDTSGVPRDERTRVLNINVPVSELRERQASAGHVSASRR